MRYGCGAGGVKLGYTDRPREFPPLPPGFCLVHSQNVFHRFVRIEMLSFGVWGLGFGFVCLVRLVPTTELLNTVTTNSLECLVQNVFS